MFEEAQKPKTEPKKTGNLLSMFKKPTPAPKPAEPQKKPTLSSPFAYLQEESKKKLKPTPTVPKITQQEYRYQQNIQKAKQQMEASKF